jgi:hypothetical protein
MPRISPAFLTSRELDALIALIAIAKAGPQNEGDYQGFDYRAMERAREKLATMKAKLNEI